MAEKKEKIEEEILAKQEIIRALTEEIRTLRTAIKKNEVGLSQLSYVVTQARKYYDGFDEFIKVAADEFNKDFEEDDADQDAVTEEATPEETNEDSEYDEVEDVTEEITPTDTNENFE